ncbi:sigma-70 family RNA polymerase sigma factor [bacterium]|nr:sigma-70 family RNA polymerase sigma factor [bacterium]
MPSVTQFLTAIERGESAAADQLLPLVYGELRALAAQRLAQEKPGQTLQATALVHEAYLRLIGGDPARSWDGRGHFFAAAAQAMRRILVESARRKQLARRVSLEDFEPESPAGDERLLELEDALERLASTEPLATQIVELRLFAGLSVAEAAAALKLSQATAYREYAFARAWLQAALSDNFRKD